MKKKLKEKETTATEDKRIALIYCRVSSKRQEVEGSGLESQEHRCRAYAEREGLKVERVFKDSYTGGGDFMKRPAMSQMIAYVDSKSYKKYTIIFDDLKRFARDTIFHFKLRTTFKIREVELKCLNYSFDDSPEGTFVETVLAAQGELEKNQNKRQVVQKQQARLERGYWPFYPPPGYKSKNDPIHGKILTPHYPEASIIKEALEGYAIGRFQNHTDVANFLQGKDFLKGRKVYLECVKRLLTRSIYAGYIEYPKWEVSRRQGHHEPIVSPRTYELVLQRLNSTAKAEPRKDIHRDFPLRGFVVCGKCGEPMTASWSTGSKMKHAYYRCRNLKCVERTKSVKREDIHTPFEKTLARAVPKPQILEYATARLVKIWESLNREVLDIEGRKEKDLSEIDGQIKTLTQRIGEASNKAVIKVYEGQIEELCNKKLVLEQNLGKIRNNRPTFGTAVEVVYDFLKNPYAKWLKGNLEDQKLILKLVFSGHVSYDRENGFGTAKTALPVKVFELFSLPNSQGVEMRGVEPRCI